MQLLCLQLVSVLLHWLLQSLKNLLFHKQQVDNRDFLIMIDGTMNTMDHTELHTTTTQAMIMTIMTIIRAMITTTTIRVMMITTTTTLLRATATTTITHTIMIQIPIQIAFTMAVTASP